MAMEIVNNYNSYAVDYMDAAKKSGKNEATGVKTSAPANSKDKVQEYYEKLCRKFSGIAFNANGGKNKIALNLSSECLKRMANDPAFAEKIEKDISGIPAAHEQMLAKAKSDGIEIQGFAVRINADGSMQCSCSGSTRTSGAKQSSSMLNAEKSKKDRLEKKREDRKVLEKRAEKKAEEKHVMERMAEKKAAKEASLGTYASFDMKA